MKRPQLLLACGIASALLAGALAMSDNLTELAPVFLAVSAGSFAWRFWGGERPSGAVAASRTASPFGKAAKILTVAGVLAFGLSGLGLLVPSLEELIPAAIVGGLLLVLSLAARIADGIQNKRVNPTQGGLSIAGLMLLLGASGAVLLVLTVCYYILKGFGLI